MSEARAQEDETTKCIGPTLESTELSREQLLAALDTQIQFDGDSLRNEGWTRWAIWGALAALVWAATDLWVQSGLSVVRTAVLALLTLVFWKFIAEAIWLLLPSSRIEVGPARFRLPADTVNPLRPKIAATGLQYLLILILPFYFKLSALFFLGAYAALGFGMSVFMLLFGTLAGGIPTRLGLRTTISALTAVQLVWLAAAGYQVVWLVQSDFRSYTIPEVRLALLFNAGAFLLIKLTTTTSSEHLVNKLTQLRQHIAFGRVQLPEANKQADSLLNGVTLTEVLHPVVQAIRKEESGVQPLLEEANRLLELARHEMPPPNQRPENALRLLDQMEVPLNRIRQQVKRINRAWNRFVGQSVVLGFYSRESKPEAQVVAAAIRTRFAESEAKVNECLHQHRSLKADACQLAQDLTRRVLS